jgi:predicted permease
VSARLAAESVAHVRRIALLFQQLVPIIAPVLICVLLGYTWSRSKQPFDRDFLTRIIMNIGSPCLILRGIAGLDAQTEAFVMMMVIGICLLCVCALVSAVVLRILGQPLRSFLPPVVFGNAGNLGLPLCFYAFGEEGLGLAIAIYLVGSVAQFVLGPLFQGRQPAWETLVKTPIIYAAVFGIGSLASGYSMPVWLENSIGLLAGLAIPLMLLALGHALGSFKIERAGVAVGIAVFRLTLGFAAGVVAVEVFQLTGVMRGVVIVESAMPVAVFNFLLAARYNRHPQDVAGAIVVSTLVSFLTLPALILFALG